MAILETLKNRESEEILRVQEVEKEKIGLKADLEREKRKLAELQDEVEVIRRTQARIQEELRAHISNLDKNLSEKTAMVRECQELIGLYKVKIKEAE